MEQSIVISWQYQFNPEKSLSLNISNLTNKLNYDNIEFFTEDTFNPEDIGSFTFKKFLINKITILGDVPYLKWNLKSALDDIIKHLEFFVNSDESYETKLYELQKSKLIITEFLIHADIYKPSLLQTNFIFVLHNIKQMNHIDIRWDQCMLTDEVYVEWQQHQEVRHAYTNLLYNHLDLEIEKLKLQSLGINSKEESMNTKKELQLLEVWIALNESNFISHVPDSKKYLHRKSFFELFNLTDRNYDDRNKQFKKKKNPRAEFLKQLVDVIENY